MWISDAAVVFATLVGPILAVQAQKNCRKNRLNDGKTGLFEAVMATRQAGLLPAHGKALNMIAPTFYDKERQGVASRTKSEMNNTRSVKR